MNRTGRYFLAAFLATLPPAHAATCIEPRPDAPIPDIALEEVAPGFDDPVHIAHAGDGSGRLYVVEQRGTIRVIDKDRVLPKPFLDIRDRVESGGEKGLLSIAFHPSYRENGVFYVDYTTVANGLRTVVSQFRRAGAGRADPKSEVVLLKIRQPYGNHNGGQLAFGPDHYLYIGMGDGGWANDPEGNGQNPATLLGALLRIAVTPATASRPYTIPVDNPFLGRRGYRDEIWAYGLRNPWRFSFDAANGRLYLADVGQDEREEIDVIEKGGNYGWNIMEGDICTPGVSGDCDKGDLKVPILAYTHAQGRSITGGFVYRGRRIAALCGVYVYADYVSGRVWGLRYDGQRVTRQRELLKTRHAISSFGQDQDLELYLADHRAGKILRIVHAARRDAAPRKRAGHEADPITIKSLEP